MMKSRYSRLESAFDAGHVNFWSNLSRLNNLMVIMNISMFFLTGLVIKEMALDSIQVAEKEIYFWRHIIRSL